MIAGLSLLGGKFLVWISNLIVTLHSNRWKLQAFGLRNIENVHGKAADCGVPDLLCRWMS